MTEIYKITDKRDGRMYIGQHLVNFRNYWASGKYILAAAKKHGKDNFTRNVIMYCNTQEEANRIEAHFIKVWKTLAPNGYNIRDGGHNGNSYAGKTEEEMLKFKKKMSDLAKGKKTSEETKKKMSIANTGRKFGPRPHGVKNKISESLKGRKKSEEHRRNISEAQKGRTFSVETRKKISEGNKGKKRSEETKRKRSEAEECRKGKEDKNEEKNKN